MCQFKRWLSLSSLEGTTFEIMITLFYSCDLEWVATGCFEVFVKSKLFVDVRSWTLVSIVEQPLQDSTIHLPL